MSLASFEGAWQSGGGAEYFSLMPQTTPGSGSTTPVLVDTPVHRTSRRIRGLPPEDTEDTAVLQTIPTGMERAMTNRYTLQNPLVPKSFHGDVFEDVEDWMTDFERVAEYNEWDDVTKRKNVYFCLEDGARTWFQNREEQLTSWREFRRQLLDTYASPDRRERAERAIQARVQLPNESVTAFVEDMTRLFRRADPGMTEDKKLRHLMRGVKEQLFAGLVRNPPKTVAEFLAEAVSMEKMLQHRSNTAPAPSVHHRATYAKVLRQPASSPPLFVQAAHPVALPPAQPVPYIEERRPFPMPVLRLCFRRSNQYITPTIDACPLGSQTFGALRIAVL